MAVSNVNPLYSEMLKVWETVRDAVKGQYAVKKKRDAYLPGFVPEDTARYDKYLERAYWPNITGYTRDSLLGMVFKKPPVVGKDFPEQIKFMLENFDGGGHSAEQCAKSYVDNVLQAGRHGLFADYPAVPKDMDKETEISIDPQPYVKEYFAESIINWREDTRHGRTILSMVKLCEQYEDWDEDDTSFSLRKRYITLRLRHPMQVQRMIESGRFSDEALVPTDQMIYTVEVCDDDDEHGHEFIPRIAGGLPLDHIPFYFIGSKSNTALPNWPALYDISTINYALYHNIADMEEAAFLCGQPTTHIDTGNTSASEWNTLNPNGVRIGSRMAVITQGGKLEQVQASENNLILKVIENKKDEIVNVGAKIIQRAGQVETAEAARLNASAESSVLDTVVSNVSDAMESAFEDCLRYKLGKDANVDNVLFRLNREYFDGAISAQDAAAIITLGDSSIIARSDQRNMLRTGRIQIDANRTDEDIEKEINETL